MRDKLVNKIANLLSEISILRLSDTQKADAIVSMLEKIDEFCVQELVEEYDFQENSHE